MLVRYFSGPRGVAGANQDGRVCVAAADTEKSRGPEH